MSVTQEDRERAWLVLCALPISIPGYSPETVRKAQDHLAQALADERERVLAPVLALADEWDAHGDRIDAQLIRRAAGQPQ